jgi:hypothetical protein
MVLDVYYYGNGMGATIIILYWEWYGHLFSSHTKPMLISNIQMIDAITHVGLVWDENKWPSIPNILATAQQNCTGQVAYIVLLTCKKSSKTQ